MLFKQDHSKVRRKMLMPTFIPKSLIVQSVCHVFGLVAYYCPRIVPLCSIVIGSLGLMIF